jgi:hypothetical protein
VDFFAISEGFNQQAARGVALVFGHPFTAVITKLGFLQQFPVEVVLIRGATPVEPVSCWIRPLV